MTDFTAHRLRLEYANELDSIPGAAAHPLEVPARLVLVNDQSDGKSATQSAGATRVWLVGRRPGRIRVKLASIADSPLVKTALPPALVRQRKAQRTGAHHAPGVGHFWDTPQTLWVTVTDEDRVWPSGITAQLVTGEILLLCIVYASRLF